MSEVLVAIVAAKKAILAVLPVIGLTALAGVLRTILSQERHSLRGFFRGLVLAVVVGVLSWNALVEFPTISDSLRAAIVATHAFIADDLVVGVMAIMRIWRTDPERVLRIVRGRGRR